jgi:dihydrofolate reductase
LKIVIIAAVAENNVIGRTSGEMPWHSKEEFRHFKQTTLGFPIIMGRKTFESLEGPLKGRLNIIITTNLNYKAPPEVITFRSLNTAYDYCRSAGYEKIFVIGGGYIFKDAVNDADEMIISRMHFNADGDVYFPDIDESVWQINDKDEREGFTINYYNKRLG